MARSCSNYKAGMNFLDIASYATADINTYCIILILVNMILLPNAILLYGQSGISLKNEIYDKETLGKDIVLGLILAAVSAIISLLSLVVMKGRTDLAFAGWEKTIYYPVEKWREYAENPFWIHYRLYDINQKEIFSGGLCLEMDEALNIIDMEIFTD